MKTLILHVRNLGLAFNTSVAALAGVSRDAGFECESLVIDDEQSVATVVDQVLAYQPDLICATLMTRDILGFQSFFREIKKHTNAFTAVGGYHTTIRPRHVAQWDGVDGIGIGEGERPFAKLIRAIADGRHPETMPGLWVRGPGGFGDSIPPADPEPNIDDLPLWDYSLASDAIFHREAARRLLATRAGRACPFACTYCSVPVWEATNGLRNGSSVNVRSVAKLCAEVAHLRDEHGPTDIEFWDPQFPFGKEWLTELAERFPVDVGLPFRALMHPKTLNQQRIEMLRKAGCTRIYCGLESGDNDLRRTVLNKACTDDDIVKTIAAIKAAGIQASAFLMWNLPGETREQAEKTIEMIERIGFDQIRCHGYIPLPGTVLGDAAHLEFPYRPVDRFEPLAEWRDDRDTNLSAMSEEDYRHMFAEFRKLNNRYGLLEQGWDRMPDERLRRISDLLRLDRADDESQSRLKYGFSRPDELTLIVVSKDGSERRVFLRAAGLGGNFYVRTDHCFISYDGASMPDSFARTLEHIRAGIEHVPFEQL